MRHAASLRPAARGALTALGAGTPGADATTQACAVTVSTAELMVRVWLTHAAKGACSHD